MSIYIDPDKIEEMAYEIKSFSRYTEGMETYIRDMALSFVNEVDVEYPEPYVREVTREIRQEIEEARQLAAEITESLDSLSRLASNAASEYRYNAQKQAQTIMQSTVSFTLNMSLMKDLKGVYQISKTDMEEKISLTQPFDPEENYAARIKEAIKNENYTDLQKYVDERDAKIASDKEKYKDVQSTGEYLLSLGYTGVRTYLNILGFTEGQITYENGKVCITVDGKKYPLDIEGIVLTGHTNYASVENIEKALEKAKVQINYKAVNAIDLDSWTVGEIEIAKKALVSIGYRNITLDHRIEDNLVKDLIDFMRGYGKISEFYSSNQDKKMLFNWLKEAIDGEIKPLAIFSVTFENSKRLTELGYKDVFLFNESAQEYEYAVSAFLKKYGLTKRMELAENKRKALNDWLNQAVKEIDEKEIHILDPIIKDYTDWGENTKSNGQAAIQKSIKILGIKQASKDVFTNYGGIIDTDMFVKATWGDGYKMKEEKTIEGISNITQEVLESRAGNCALTSITKVLKYFGDYLGYTNIPPSLVNVYKDVREIAEKEGYRPDGKGLIYDLVDFPAGDIPIVINKSWEKFGYAGEIAANSDILFTTDDNNFNIIKNEIDKKRPMLLNIAFGDYPGHTVTVVGYKTYENSETNVEKKYIKIYDNWSDQYRYIDWDLLKRYSPMSVVLTTFNLPE